jgi:hypothetical protein
LAGRFINLPHDLNTEEAQIFSYGLSSGLTVGIFSRFRSGAIQPQNLEPLVPVTLFGFAQTKARATACRNAALGVDQMTSLPAFAPVDARHPILRGWRRRISATRASEKYRSYILIRAPTLM